MWFKSAANKTNGAASRGGKASFSVLGAGLKIEGDVVSAGELHLDGALSGNLTADKLTIGEKGSVTGMIEAQSAVIHGVLAGRLAAITVVLGRTAQVTADIVYVSMKIEPGAVFEGYSRRVDRLEAGGAAALSLPASRPDMVEPPSLGSGTGRS